VSKNLEQQPSTDYNWCAAPYNDCSAVRLQGQCAAGYAFSAAKVLEYAFNVSGKGNNIWLSPQEAIDCSGNFGNVGCNGGFVTNTLKYTTYYGLNYDKSYPYTDRQGACQGTTKMFMPRTYNLVPAGNNDMIKQSLHSQPLSAGLDATQLQFYHQGIYNGPCSTTKITHFMTLIGYGSYQGTDYWRLENSWGTSWGQAGYMFMQRYSGFNYSPCGISQQVTYPVL
jgi:C1A family cysteine protease